MFILHVCARYYVCVFKYVCMYMYMCIYIYMCVCVCVYVYIYIHTHTYMHVFVSGSLTSTSLNCMGPLMWIFSTKYIRQCFVTWTWLNVWIWRTDLLLHLDFWLGKGWHPQRPCVLQGSAVFIYIYMCVCVCLYITGSHLIFRTNPIK